MFSIGFTAPVAFMTVAPDKQIQYKFENWESTYEIALADYFSYVLVDDRLIADKINHATNNSSGGIPLLTMDSVFAAKYRYYVELMTHDAYGEPALKGIYLYVGKEFRIGTAMRIQRLIKSNFPDLKLLVQMTETDEFKEVEW